MLCDYLPHAIGSGCTSEWAEVTAALTGTSQEPSWYRSSRPLSVTDLALLARATPGERGRGRAGRSGARIA